MVTEQMKTDAQRFGNGKKGYNIKQVAEMLENAGGKYTAGEGINISEDNVISAVVYSGGEGISISNDNEISLKGWKPVTSATNWRNDYCIEQGGGAYPKLKQDLIIKFDSSFSAINKTVFVPKDTIVGTNQYFEIFVGYASPSTYENIHISMFHIFRNESYTSKSAFSSPPYKTYMKSPTETNGIISFDIGERTQCAVHRYADEISGSGADEIAVILYVRSE